MTFPTARKTLLSTCLLLLLCLNATLPAQVPQLLNYQGRVAVAGANYDGQGFFRFALVSSDGSTTYWSNDGTASGAPASVVTLTVSKGLYSVILGDPSLPHMTSIPANVFGNSDLHLRVWFDDGVHGSQLLSPDERIAAVAYAVTAGSATTVAAGAIGPAQLAPNAVDLTKLAPRGMVVATTTTAPAGSVAVSSTGSNDPGVTFTPGSTAEIKVPGLTVSLNTTGRPMVVGLLPGSQGTGSFLRQVSSSGSALYLYIRRDGSLIANHVLANLAPGGGTQILIPPSAATTIDLPPAGSHTYTIGVSVGSSSDSATLSSVVLFTYEL